MPDLHDAVRAVGGFCLLRQLVPRGEHFGTQRERPVEDLEVLGAEGAARIRRVCEELRRVPLPQLLVCALRLRRGVDVLDQEAQTPLAGQPHQRGRRLGNERAHTAPAFVLTPLTHGIDARAGGGCNQGQVRSRPLLLRGHGL